MRSLGQLGAGPAPSVIGRMVEALGSWEIPLLLSPRCYAVRAGTWLLIDAEKPLGA